MKIGLGLHEPKCKKNDRNVAEVVFIEDRTRTTSYFGKISKLKNVAEVVFIEDRTRTKVVQEIKKLLPLLLR